MKHRGCGFRSRFSSGFSLIEVLVAVLVVSIGLLGVVGLQLVALKHNTNAMYRGQAANLAYDVIDRARANPDQSYALALGDDPTGPDCEGGGCTPSQLRDYDLEQWITSVQNTIDGDGEVVVNGDIITVTLQWPEEQAPPDPDCADGMVCMEVSTSL